jgi:hypothetical protein
LPDGFSTGRFMGHEDVRVRREALKLALKIPAERDQALLDALPDPDPRMSRVALTAALENCPPAALSPVTRIAQDASVASEIRVLAIKVLGRAGGAAALAALLPLVDGGTSWLGRPRLAPRSLEMLAALMALAARWRNDREAAPLIALAAESTDPDIRNAVSGTPRATAAVRR